MLIYKYTKSNNEIYIGDLNSYGHKLIYKAKFSNGKMIPLYSNEAYYEIQYSRKRGVIWKMKKIIEIIMQ